MSKIQNKIKKSQLRNERKMISKFSIGNLGLISTFCGISALAMMVNFKKSEKEKHARQPFCREPVKLLRNHQGANHVLGTPITLGVRTITSYFY